MEAYLALNQEALDRYQHSPPREENAMTDGKGVKFERIRRITGYLVGPLDRWNDAKQAEERDRVRHSIGGEQEEQFDNGGKQ